MPRIDPGEIQFANDSFMDDVGRVFFWQGRVLRGIYHQSWDYVQLLFKAGIVQALVDKKVIVKSWQTDLELDGFSHIIEHEKADFIVQPIHYTREMARRAALNWIDANLELAPHKLGYIDGHYYNIAQTVDANPVQIDFGSITPLKSEHHGLDQLIKCLINPLLLLSKCRHGALFRATLNHFGPTQSDISAIYAGATVHYAGMDRVAFLQSAREMVAGLDVSETGEARQNKIKWEKYYGVHPQEFIRNPGLPVPTIPDLRLRLDIIEKLVAQHKPRSLIDVGGNTGYFSLPFAKQGIPILLTDLEEAALDLFHSGLWAINPGWKIATGYVNAIELHMPYQADFALALALTHHLAVGKGYKFDMIASRLSRFTSNCLVTEFMPHGMGNRETKPNPLPQGYTLENCLDAFRRHFHKVEVIPYEMPASRPLRTMIFCAGKK